MQLLTVGPRQAAYGHVPVAGVQCLWFFSQYSKLEPHNSCDPNCLVGVLRGGGTLLCQLFLCGALFVLESNPKFVVTVNASARLQRCPTCRGDEMTRGGVR
jgi:hypothetical protein